MATGLLLLRLAVGLTLAAHGAQKLFGWFGGGGLEATGQGLASLGFQPGRRYALLAGSVEAGGGVLLAAGFLTPLAAAMVIGIMLVAAMSVHLKQGFFMASGGYEYNLVLGMAGLTIAFTGPGALSLDAMLGHSVSGDMWGLTAALLGLVGGAFQLAQRRPPVTVPAH